ncbi:Lateral organ boundaries LOB domain-containing protein [Dioscorea alata]|uniref:Lateral organ boundaries LOB domain-containing protein n=1 Tax=Dioscorea alata TaxID=55571 RepID=A0ACB7U547_DIOAL|nr:Lateral organ boundaries LOB domain-containing protein [Dioscorea alata]
MHVGERGDQDGESSNTCGACKHLKKTCARDCIFAPYFDSEQGANNFDKLHKVFGESNVSKILREIPDHHKRLEAINTTVIEAKAYLQQVKVNLQAQVHLKKQILHLQKQLPYLRAQLVALQLSSKLPPPPPSVLMQPQFSVSDLSLSFNQEKQLTDLQAQLRQSQTELAYLQAELARRKCYQNGFPNPFIYPGLIHGGGGHQASSSRPS